MKILVNAIPLLGANTGIARYLRCLYNELSRLYGDTCQIHYFDGKKVALQMPEPPENLDGWSGLADLFWKLPPRLAFGIRLALHAKRQHAFTRAIKGYDIYHEAGFFPFSAPPTTKTVFTIHDASIIRYPQHHPTERVLFMNKFLEKRAHSVDAILTVSHFSKQEIIELLHIPDSKISVTHLAHLPSQFYPARSEITSQLTAEGLPERYFLFVGSGDPRKNIAIIPKALQLTTLDVSFVNAGWSGWMNETDSCIINLGYVSDEKLRLLYQGALALIYPSVYEGFGLPVIEAMACGCPVVTTKKASLPEVAGEAALFLCNPHDPNELARIMENLATDDSIRNSLSQSSLRNVQRFSWESTASTTMNVFQKTLSKRN